MRIEITGAIGSGKTTLAASLAGRFGWALATEDPERVPFWAETYGGDRRYQLEKDLGFLLFHAATIRELQPSNLHPLVCDFSFVQDLVYARLGQNSAELEVYEAVYGHAFRQCGVPRLIIHLRCPVSTLLARIARRGRTPERGLTGEFLKDLSDALDRAIDEIADTPILFLDSDRIDFRSDRNFTEVVRAKMEALA